MSKPKYPYNIEQAFKHANADNMALVFCAAEIVRAMHSLTAAIHSPRGESLEAIDVGDEAEAAARAQAERARGRRYDE